MSFDDRNSYSKTEIELVWGENPETVCCRRGEWRRYKQTGVQLAASSQAVTLFVTGRQ